MEAFVRRQRRVAPLVLFLALSIATFALAACGDDGGGGTDTVAADAAGSDARIDDVASPADVPAADAPDDDGIAPPPDSAGDDAAADTGDDTGAGPPDELTDLPADITLTQAELDGPVRVYRDEWGVPHIYATTRHDAFYAQGFVVALDRLLQMHLFRMAGAGRMAEIPFMGPGELSGDVYMRTLNLRDAAAATWDLLLQDPEAAETVAVANAFAEGVNAYVQALRDGTMPMPGDLALLGGPDIVQEWTPVDSFIIGRVQSWDLSFDGYWDELDAFQWLMTLREKFGETPLAGVIDDVFLLAPVTGVSVLDMPESVKAARRATPRMSDIANHPFYARLGGAQLAALRQTSERAQAVREAARLIGARDAFGSNSWALSGQFTASGAAVLANDPHLTLRNPSIFHQIHIDTTEAGGDVALSGVSFPGIPGLILGRNANVAWSATVFPADVTDIYVEEVVEAADGPDGVVFNGATVPLTVREEILRYPAPAAGCETMLEEWTDDYAHTLAEEDGVCAVTIQIEEVPHHGPVVPGSRGTDTEGNPILMTWKWVGFQPTQDLRAVTGYNFAANVDEFLESARFFGVGNQNWLAVDTQGNIGYGAWMLVPGRPWTEQEPVVHVPWLPLPGTGEYEWDGWVPHESLPNTKNPTKGWLATANNAGWGVTLDSDPLNDGIPYHVWVADIGLRAQRINELLAPLLAAGGVTVPDLQAIQGDHHSNLGERMRPSILEAVAAREATDDPPSAAVLAARDRLAAWSLAAADGAWPEATQQEIDDSIATSIFNAWVTRLTLNVFENKEMAGLTDQMKGRLLVRMMTDPELLATYDPVTEDSLLWDDLSTVDVVETRGDIVYRSLVEALEFLSNPDVVGVADKGGFGTADMDAWRWGLLHTIQLTHPFGAPIPPVDEWPDGYPRHGDRFSVDASHTGLASHGYRYTHGPAMRAVYVMTPDAPGTHFCVIPGGETGRPFTRHYGDEMARWARNQAHVIARLPDELLPLVEDVLEMAP